MDLWVILFTAMVGVVVMLWLRRKGERAREKEGVKQRPEVGPPGEKEGPEAPPPQPSPKVELPSPAPEVGPPQPEDATTDIEKDLKNVQLDEQQKDAIAKRIRVAEQTKKSFENKGKHELNLTSNKLPPGQKLTKKWVVLDLGLRPDSWDITTWTLKLTDQATQRTQSLSLEDIKKLGVKQFTSDFHCYTGWTIQNLPFTGVSFKKIIDQFAPSASWKYMYQIGADGYTTNAPREVFDKEDVFLAWEVNGEPIPEEHGYIRLINPMLYGSKSAKFVSEIHFMEKEEKGFWELRGVHDRGNVMLEERYNKKKRDNTSLEEVQRIIQECKEKLQIELDLSGFGLEEIPEEVFELTHIRTLLLFNNNLKTFPEKLSKLTNLQTLSVNANKLTEIPPVVSMLPELNELWMCDNKVTHLPKHLLDAPELSVLGIESNMLEELPEWISEVPSLTILFADLNRIKRIPRQIGDRPWGALLFNGNPVEFVPTELSKQKDIIFLGFYGCSLFPSEVLEEGTKGILAFLEKGDLGH